MRNIFSKTVTAYLTYLGTVLPDIAQQTRVISAIYPLLDKLVTSYSFSRLIRAVYVIAYMPPTHPNFWLLAPCSLI